MRINIPDLKDRRRSRGASFLEPTIAVLILGVIFMFALKGAALLEAMRAVIAAQQIRQIQNRVLLYEDEYHALPGDDPQAAARFHRPGAVASGDNGDFSLAGNGRIDGKLSDSLSPNGEQFMAWRDLRYAKLFEGDPIIAGASAMPDNVFGGVYGFDEGNLGWRNGSLCLTNVPGRAAQIIDKQLDDGDSSKGLVRSTSRFDPTGAFNHFDTPDSLPYDFKKTYIVCAPILP